MKYGLKISQVLWVFFVALVGMACDAGCLQAAGEAYDINLKELRQTPYDINLKELQPTVPRRTKASQRKQGAKAVQASAPAASDASKDSSSYTVRAGDYPLLILMKHYGLSQAVADQLVPQVMRLNNLRDPRKLTIGQRLIIPVAPPGQSSPKDSVPSAPAAASDVAPVVLPPAIPPPAVLSSGVQPPVVEQPVIPQPVVAPVEHAPAVQATPVQPPAFEAAPVREVQVHSATPCLLAREFADTLALSTPAITALMRAESVSMVYNGQKLVVACGLTDAETYTAQRLLARHGAQLLLFEGDEPSRTVIEELADSLGIPFRLANGTSGDELPATYFFSAVDVSGRDIRLTILPQPATQEKAKQ